MLSAFSTSFSYSKVNMMLLNFNSRTTVFPRLSRNTQRTNYCSKPQELCFKVIFHPHVIFYTVWKCGCLLLSSYHSGRAGPRQSWPSEMTGEAGKKLDAHLLVVFRSQLWDQGLQRVCVCALTSSQLCTRHSLSGKETGVFCSEVEPNTRGEILGCDW